MFFLHLEDEFEFFYVLGVLFQGVLVFINVVHEILDVFVLVL